MDFQKAFDQMKTVGARLQKVDFGGLVEALGIESRRGRGSFGAVLIAFGAGLTVGAGAALLLAPMTGKELREKIMALAAKLPWVEVKNGAKAGASASGMAEDRAEASHDESPRPLRPPPMSASASAAAGTNAHTRAPTRPTDGTATS